MLKKNILINLKKSFYLNRLFVYKSNKYIYCQIISPTGKVLFSVSSLDINYKKYIIYNFGKNINVFICKFIGKCLAYKALSFGLKRLIFDRSIYKYHGCIKMIFIYSKKFGLIF